MPFARQISRAFLIFTIFILFVVLNGCAAKTVLVVDKYGNGDYTSIRAAVSDWEQGKKLIINPGVYDEQLILKTWLKIDGLDGVAPENRSALNDEKNKVVIAFSGDGPAVVGRDVSEVRLSNLVLKKFNKKKTSVVKLRGTDIEIKNCTISGGKMAGIEAARFGSLVIQDSTIKNNNYAGIFLHHQARADIQKNLIAENGRGISIARHPEGIPKNRTIYRDEEEDIEVLIKENSITDNSFAGIFMSSGSKADVISNSFVSNASNAIHGEGKERTINLDMGGVVVSEQSKIKMLGNSISFSDMGIIFRETASGKVFENTVINNENYGIVVSGYGKPEFIGNIIKDNNGTGIILKTSTETLLQDNQILTNKLHGIEVVDSARPLIEGNWIVQNGKHGIYAYKNARPIIKQNILVNNSMVGLLVVSDSKVEAFNNTFYKNTKAGVWFSIRSGGMFANNVIVGSETGISILKNSEYQPKFSNNVLWQNNITFKGFLEKPEGNYVTDPLFKDANNLDFTPLADSPLVSTKRGKRIVIGAKDPLEN